MNKLSLLTLSAVMALTAFAAEATSTGCFVALNGVGNQEIVTSNGVNTYYSNGAGVVCGVASSDSVDLSKLGYVSTGTQQNGLAIQSVQTFSTIAGSNPLLFQTVENIPVASVNAAGGQVIVAGITGRTIYPAGLIVMASGTAATATSEKIVCLPSGNLLATIPIASLVSLVPVQPFGATVTAGQALGQGCVAGDGIFASNVGSNLATTTDVFVNMPYTVQ